jgi:hypothetical protein
MQALFITTEDIKAFTLTNGNLDPDKFIQFVKVAQDIHIQNYLGTKLFDKINDDIVANTLIAPYSTLLTTYIKPMVIHWSMVEFLPYAAYTLANKGVFKHGSENSTTVDKNEVDFLIEKERSVAQNYTRRFIDFICNNSTLFPEYNANTNSDVYPSKESDSSGWLI